MVNDEFVVLQIVIQDLNGVRYPCVRTKPIKRPDYHTCVCECQRKQRVQHRITGLEAGLLLHEVRYSPVFRAALLCRHPSTMLSLVLHSSGKAPLDLCWSYILLKLAVQYSQLQYTMSWLSTLGGAFSALGDKNLHCASVAGKISVEQLQLAMRLGDQGTVVRCQMYAAISWVQQARFQSAARLLRHLRSSPQISADKRLRSMHRAICNKLRYEDRRHTDTPDR